MKLTTLAISNIKHNIKKYGMYFFAMCFCVFTTYTFLALINSKNVLSKLNDSSSYQSMFIGFSIAIFVFILFFLISSNNSFIRSRKKELSTYALFGMQNSKIGLLLFIETLFLGLVALIVGIALGIFFSKLFTMLLLKMVMSTYSGDIKFVIEGNAILITFLIYFGVFCIMGLSGTRIINKFQLVDLFKGERISEKKSKGSYFLLAISLILILGGYYFAISPDAVEVVILMIPIIIVVILGTFLFYIGGFQKVLYLIKRNKSSFYKKTKLIPISMLSHRSRTMATMMATITVLVAIGTTVIAFGYTLYQGAEQQTYDSNSFDMYYYTNDETVNEDAHAIFNKYNIAIDDEITFDRYVSKPTSENIPDSYNYLFDNDSSIYLLTYKESVYNQIANITKGSGKGVSVNPGNVMVVYPNFQDDIDLKDAKLRYADKTLNATFEKTSNSFSFGVSMFTLVLDDSDFDELVQSGAIATQFEDSDDYWPLTAINYPDALQSSNIAAELKNVLEDKTGSYRLAYYTYNDLLIYFGLLCFIGFFMCAVFILMTASMLYFKQITVATEERKQYIMLRKIGMDGDEESKIVALKPIFFFPLILGIVHSIFAMKGADTIIFSNMIASQGDTFISVLKTSSLMYAAYTLVYTLFYFVTKSQYKQTIK